MIVPNSTERALSAQGVSYGPKLEALFDQYWNLQEEEDREPGVWNMDATLAWCQDLAVSPEDAVMLAIAHLCQAKDMGKFEKKGWVDGWKAARKDTVQGQQAHVSQLRANLTSDPQLYRKVYAYTFDYARGTENTNVRVLPLDTAGALWDLLLPQAPELMFQPDSVYNFHANQDGAQEALDKWKEFLASPSGGKGRAVSKDVWNQVRLVLCLYSA